MLRLASFLNICVGTNYGCFRFSLFVEVLAGYGRVLPIAMRVGVVGSNPTTDTLNFLNILNIHFCVGGYFNRNYHI